MVRWRKAWLQRAREWATYNVRVNSITPGFFPGEQNRRLLFNEDGTATARGQVILAEIFMARIGHDHLRKAHRRWAQELHRDIKGGFNSRTRQLSIEDNEGAVILGRSRFR